MRRAALLLLFVLFSLPAAADELTPEQQEIFESIELNHLSPYCSGRTLKDCPSSASADLKEELRDQIAAGATEEEISNQLLERFGEEITAAPDLEGFGIVAWAAPILFFIAGAVAIRFLFFRT